MDLLVDALAQIVPDMLGHLQEGRDNQGIELAARPALNLFPSHGERQFGSVGPILGHSIQRVGHREDACSQGDLIPFEPARITSSIEFFLV